MMIKLLFALAALVAVLAPKPALAGVIGEPAPALGVKEWVKGGPVTIKPGTNIYVVEIWRSSIPACRAVITNLNDIQNRFKANGVVLAGIGDESVEELKAFVQHDGTNIEYAIAADDNRQTARSYMMPLKELGLPHCFVVGTNGSVLWHGHPLGVTHVLEQIFAGQYDVEQVRRIEIAPHQLDEYVGLAQRADFRAQAAGKKLLANRTNDLQLLCDMAFRISTEPKLAKRDLALAGEALDQAEKLSGTNKTQVMAYRAVWLFTSGQQDAGVRLATQALAAAQTSMGKTNIQRFLRYMEAHSAAAKTNQSNAGQPQAAPTTNHVSTADTNSSSAVPVKDPAGKP